MSDITGIEVPRSLLVRQEHTQAALHLLGAASLQYALTRLPLALIDKVRRDVSAGDVTRYHYLGTLSGGINGAAKDRVERLHPDQDSFENGAVTFAYGLLAVIDEVVRRQGRVLGMHTGTQLLEYVYRAPLNKAARLALARVLFQTGYDAVDEIAQYERELKDPALDPGIAPGELDAGEAGARFAKAVYDIMPSKPEASERWDRWQ